MSINEKAPNCWRSVEAQKQMGWGKHPAPIVTHYPRHRKRRMRRRRHRRRIHLTQDSIIRRVGKGFWMFIRDAFCMVLTVLASGLVGWLAYKYIPPIAAVMIEVTKEILT